MERNAQQETDEHNERTAVSVGENLPHAQDLAAHIRTPDGRGKDDKAIRENAKSYQIDKNSLHLIRK